MNQSQTKKPHECSVLFLGKTGDRHGAVGHVGHQIITGCALTHDGKVIHPVLNK